MRAVLLLVVSMLFLSPTAGFPQSVETELPGVTAELVELRLAGGVLRLAVRFANGGSATVEPTRFAADRIVLVDMKSRKKYFPLKDANGQFIAGQMGDWINGGRIQLRIPARQSTVLWAYFEPLPLDTVVSVEVPTVFPFEKVVVTEGPSKVFASRSARSTPGGAVATLVSATRADQSLTVRLRLEAEKGARPSLGGSYFEYRNVFLFDTASKRKYALLKDADGRMQGQPNTVGGADGGSFILDWNKTTLVSLTFQAPPDTVQVADLLLPRFLPIEGMAITGSGGAAAGGIAVAGKELGLESALKELHADVTPTEITIDLAADVLFEFDKATLKKEAEPSLQHLATVLKANPTAAVAIDGHTDAKGADAYNQTLSEQRAASVKQWLVTNAQVSGANITTRGWGKAKPIAPNTKPDGSDSPEGRAKNRRVQVVVRKGA